VHFILSLQLANDEFPIRVQNADSLSPICVRFCVTCDVRFPNHIHWTFHAVGRPSRHSCIPSHPPIRIKVIDEACPRLAHQAAELRVALAPVSERIDGISKALNIIEDKCYLGEMRGSLRPDACGGHRVKSIAVSGYIGCSPGMAGQSSSCNEHLVAKVGSTASKLGTVWRAKHDIAAQGLRTWYSFIWIRRIGFQYLLHNVPRPCILSRCGGCVRSARVFPLVRF
jgi:hypothetical protein